MSNLSDIERSAGALLWTGFDGHQPPDELCKLLGEGRAGGAILFRRNIDRPQQVAELVSKLRDAAGGALPPIIAVDQEGGRVARLRAPLLRLPPMRRLASLDDPELTRRAGRVLGTELASLGINLNFAPILDVDTNPSNPIIGDRAFGATAAEVIRHALPFADGLADAGLLSCGKHFPGHGDTTTDSHLELPRLQHGLERLNAVELAPFRAAVGRLPTLMTAHVVFDALDPGVPATLSRRVVTDLLRTELGYGGVVISDDLEMRAIADHYGVEDAAVRAITAGCDVLLICSKLEWTVAAHGAIVRRAEQDGAFRARLEEAARRVNDLRRRIRPWTRPSDAELARAFEGAEATALAAELSRRLPPLAP